MPLNFIAYSNVVFQGFFRESLFWCYLKYIHLNKTTIDTKEWKARVNGLQKAS